MFRVPAIQGMAKIAFVTTARTSGTCNVTVATGTFGNGGPSPPPQSNSGTFSGATFNGTASAFSTMFTIPTATVAATGTVQADAALIATGFTLVTGADDTKGVKLPAAAAGLVCIIKVDTGADLKVWPNTGDTINAIAANSAMTVVDDVCFTLVAYDATAWYTAPLLPS